MENEEYNKGLCKNRQCVNFNFTTFDIIKDEFEFCPACGVKLTPTSDDEITECQKLE